MIILVFWILSLLGMDALHVYEDHALYLSVLEVSIDEKIVKVELKVFSDDLADALRNFGGSGFQSIDENTLTQGYLNETILIGSNNQNCSLILMNNQIVGESNLISLQSNLANSEQGVSIQANYLMELFPNQQNILKLKLNDSQFYEILKDKNQVEWFESQ